MNYIRKLLSRTDSLATIYWEDMPEFFFFFFFGNESGPSGILVYIKLSTIGVLQWNGFGFDITKDLTTRLTESPKFIEYWVQIKI